MKLTHKYNKGEIAELDFTTYFNRNIKIVNCNYVYIINSHMIEVYKIKIKTTFSIISRIEGKYNFIQYLGR